MTDFTTISVPRELAVRFGEQPRVKGVTKSQLFRHMLGIEPPIDVIFVRDDSGTSLQVELFDWDRIGPAPAATWRRFAENLKRLATQGGGLVNANVDDDGLVIGRKGIGVTFERQKVKRTVSIDVAVEMAAELLKAADEADIATQNAKDAATI